MDVKEIQETIKKTLISVGLKIYKVFFIYAGMLLILNLVIYFLFKPIAQYMLTMYEYWYNGNNNIPNLEDRLYIAMLLILLLSLMSRTVTLGWDAACLKASRGKSDITFHDLTSMFPLFWKVAVMYIIELVCIYIGLSLFILPGLALMLRWSMAFYVLIEHPEYGPLKCLKQSGRLMVGEIKNLLRLGVTFFIQYLMAGLIWRFSYSLINLWKVPPLGIGYSAFYNRLVYWKPPVKTDEK